MYPAGIVSPLYDAEVLAWVRGLGMIPPLGSKGLSMGSVLNGDGRDDSAEPPVN